jgi:type I restriction enzyme S subunit
MNVNWTEVRFRELVSCMGDGGTPSTYDDANFGEGIPWATVEDVKSRICCTAQQITEKGYRICSAKKWPPGSVILTTGATIGEVGIAEIELCTKQGITGIVLNEHADALFIRYWLEENKNTLLRFSQGTTFREIRPRTLGNLRLFVPAPFSELGLEIQRAVGLCIDSVEQAISATLNSITAAEQLREGMMQQLLTGRLKPDGSARGKSEFYEHYKLGLVPKGWSACRVREIATKVTDGEHTTPQRTSSGYYLLSARNICNGHLDLKDVDFVGESELLRIRKRCDPDESDLLISCSGTIGNVCLVPPGFVGGMVRSVALVKLSPDRCLPKFIEWIFRASPMQRQMQIAASVSIQGNLFQGSIRRLWISIPAALDEQAAIVEKLNFIENLILAKEDKIIAFQRLKKAMMQNLLTGRVRLPMDGGIKKKATQWAN